MINFGYFKLTYCRLRTIPAPGKCLANTSTLHLTEHTCVPSSQCFLSTFSSPQEQKKEARQKTRQQRKINTSKKHPVRPKQRTKSCQNIPLSCLGSRNRNDETKHVHIKKCFHMLPPKPRLRSMGMRKVTSTRRKRSRPSPHPCSSVSTRHTRKISR